MAKEEFDVKELQELNIPKYMKQYCKPAALKKASAAICFTDLKMNKASKKAEFIIVPFKKMPEAINVFKKIKAEKLHVLKKVTLISLDYDGKAKEMNAMQKKGGMGAEVLSTRAGAFFETNFQLKFKLSGAEETSDVASSTTEESTATKKGKKLTEVQKSKMKENIATMQAKIDEWTSKLGIS
jgi:predicted nucleotidyltransferase component of viral defense system